MRLHHYIYKSIFALGLAVLPTLWGCRDYSEEIPEGWAPDQLYEEFQLRIRLSSGSRHASRANVPQGGERGDGREFGQHKENDVNELVLYCYNGAINASATTPVRKILYKSGINFHPTGSIGTEQVEKEEIVKFTYAETKYKYTSGDHFIVVANMGDFTVSTLGALRDKYVNNAWTKAGSTKGEYKNFVMSNEQVSVFTPGTGTEANPHKIDVTVERVAARLDYSPDGSVPTTFKSQPALQYSVTDKDAGGTSHTIGTMYLTHVRPFNVMQKPAYLLKRSAKPEAPDDVSYLAPETAYTDQAFDEFPLILEQYTWTKTAGSDYSGLYGDSYLPDVGGKGDAWFDGYSVHNNTSADGFSADGISDNATGECTTYYVVDYANENTQQASTSLSNTATGFYLRAVFVPAEVYDTAADVATSTVSTTYTDGDDIVRYRPMVTNYDETQALYFTSASEAKAYGDARPVPYVLDTFTNGVCYYPVYLRHDNPGKYTGTTSDTTTDKYMVTPMEYGIVRNNIYRLKVTFTGPGYATIPTEPSLEPLGIKPYIFVRKWYKVEHPEIEI